MPSHSGLPSPAARFSLGALGNTTRIMNLPKFVPKRVQMLCQKCNERPATCLNPQQEAKHLCEQCYRESLSPEQLAFNDHFREVLRNGKCSYCGQPAWGARASSCGEPLFWCETCGRDLDEFAQENAIPEYPLNDKAGQKRVLEQRIERECRQEEFMRRKVLERGARVLPNTVPEQKP